MSIIRKVIVNPLAALDVFEVSDKNKKMCLQITREYADEREG